MRFFLCLLLLAAKINGDCKIYTEEQETAPATKETSTSGVVNACFNFFF
jgi:hypothetical protein